MRAAYEIKTFSDDQSLIQFFSAEVEIIFILSGRLYCNEPLYIFSTMKILI